MNLTNFVALRYLRSPKSHSVINLISWVALVAIAVPTMALVIILSLHNGLSHTIEGLYNSFDSPLRITSRNAKYFDPKALNLEQHTGIKAYSLTIEDNVLLRHGEREHLATMRGVDSAYARVIPIEQLITHGQYNIQQGDLQQTVVGQGIAYNLGINPSLIQRIDIYSILPDRGSSILPTPIYRTESIIPVGVYTLDQESDNRYMFVPLDYAQQLLGITGKVSSLEILPTEETTPEKLKQELEAEYGTEFQIATRYEQKESIYRAINQEKWIIFLLLIMVLLIASLSLAGSIVILIADKRAQIETLRSMGATTKLLRAIFRSEGILIVCIGATAGLILGVGFSLIQQHFGLVKMATTTLLLDHYPVRVVLSDLVMVVVGVLGLGSIISYITTRSAIK